MRAVPGAGALAAIVLTIANAHAAGASEPARFGLGPVSAPGVAFAPRAGTALPLDQAFTTADGRNVRLAAFFDGVRPVVLVPGYHRCPELCGLTMQGVLEGLAASGLDADAYRVLRVSIDPDETAADARARIAVDAGFASTVATLRAGGPRGWPPAVAGLVCTPSAVAALEAALGYEALRLDDPMEVDGRTARAAAGDAVAPVRASAGWAHAAGFVVATPDGRIAQAFDGVRFDAAALRGALVEAADGRLGTLGERLLLVCTHLDPALRGHAGAVVALVRTVALAACALLGFWIWRHRRAPSRTLS